MQQHNARYINMLYQKKKTGCKVFWVQVHTAAGNKDVKVRISDGAVLRGSSRTTGPRVLTEARSRRIDPIPSTCDGLTRLVKTNP